MSSRNKTSLKDWVLNRVSSFFNKATWNNSSNNKEELRPSILKEWFEKAIRVLPHATEEELNELFHLLTETSHGEFSETTHDALNYIFRKIGIGAFDNNKSDNGCFSSITRENIHKFHESILVYLANSPDTFVRGGLASVITEAAVKVSQKMVELLSESESAVKEVLVKNYTLGMAEASPKSFINLITDSSHSVTEAFSSIAKNILKSSVVVRNALKQHQEAQGLAEFKFN